MSAMGSFVLLPYHDDLPEEILGSAWGDQRIQAPRGRAKLAGVNLRVLCIQRKCGVESGLCETGHGMLSAAGGERRCSQADHGRA